ncbi:MAG TPA: amidohydrolase [Sphingopyxis sp.]|uniref:amidohydrolase n=1 Tax=Sphingopyxis sp. TaxID=1908224 RepID=UPI002E34BA80|nr:amidohydrolase [Sphingopyxis sp.]HEX2813254.1 amidohydrolase [Sphingopyxis sp.]
MMKGVKGGLLAAVSLALVGCAATGTEAKSASDKPAATASADRPARFDKNPYPSTYKPYPSRLTVVKNVTIFDGEGGRIDHGSIVLSSGKVLSLGGPDMDLPTDADVYDGTGKYLTPGVIDIHSHLGDYPSPSVEGLSDGNEATGPVTAEVWAEHSVWPQDPGFTRALANGGITTLEILPGSANLMGGRSVVLKNVPARTVQGMKFPGAPYGLKMACGENPKRVYGNKGRMPSTRMGNMAVDRQTWAKAVAYKKKLDEGKAVDRDLAMETLAGVLSGEILIQNHCYRADEMAQVIDMSHEFGYKVSAFHHAVEAYKIADLLKKEDICAAMWADWWGFKMEAYDSVPENIALVYKEGACTIVHSDDANQIQRLNQEAAKALAAGRRMGMQISDEQAWTWLGINPAKAIGLADKIGSLKPGKMADVVLWNGNPFSVYTRPEKVWIDGALMFDANDPKRRPVTDFELGQPGEGDVK